MAVTFTGALSVSTAGREEIRTMMHTALGCNLAWGLADAVMYLVRTATERRRNAKLLQQLLAADKSQGRRLIADALPPLFAENIEGAMLDAWHLRLRALPVRSARLRAQDYAAALRVFALVVLATFPVVVPFIFIQETALALRVSNLLAIGMLFAGGCALGHYANERAWTYGLAMMGIGTMLVIAIMALGG